MTIATGVAKRVTYKVESTWGTIPSAGSAQALRRTKSTLDLAKDTYASQEILSSYQVQDFRHGVRSVKGTLSGELSPGTYKDFMAAAVRRAFAAVTPITGATLTIAALGTTPVTYTITRGSGSWISDGVKLGNVVRLSVGSLNAANISKNLYVLALTPTVMTVIALNGVALVAEGPISTCTITVIGKTTYVPSSGHTDLSYSIEHYYADLTLSEVFSGCKINQMNLALPPSGMGTVDFDFLGKDITTAGSQYFTSPTAETTTSILAAVNGVLMVAGSPVGLITGLSLSLKASMNGEAVVGSNTFADITEGRVEVGGQFTVLFQDATFRDYFINETEVGIYVALSTSSSATADFIALSLPRIKVGAATRDDGEKALVLTCPFTALRNTSGGSGTTTEDTTLAIQDSQA
jgi:hypothetical protein